MGGIGTFTRKTKVFVIITKNKDDKFDPVTVPSDKWITWDCVDDLKTCLRCLSDNGKILPADTELYHIGCRCEKKTVWAVQAGGATKDGQNGADYWLKNYGTLPDYYISKEEIESLGWKYKESPSKYAQGKMITFGVYNNSNGKLPQKAGRVWYEADINYYCGKRNAHRIVWSNDGLIFVTYDHYESFMEII